MPVPTIIDAVLPLAKSPNVLLQFQNVLLGRRGAIVEASSEAAGGNMDVENLLTENRCDYWRGGSVATASAGTPPEISVTFARAACAVDFIAYNWSNNLLPWKYELYNGDPEGTGDLLAETDWISPIVQGEPADFPYETFPWTLRPSDERLLEMVAEMRLSSFWELKEPVYGVTHVRVIFDCREGANGDVDYIQTSLFFGGLAWSPHFNFQLGAGLSPVIRSEIRRTASRAKMGLRRTPGSEVTIALDHLSDEEALATLFAEWVRREGEFARVFISLENAPGKRRFFYDGGAF